MDRNPVTPWQCFGRICFLMCLIGFMNWYMVLQAKYSQLLERPTKPVLGFEYSTLITGIVGKACRYLIYPDEVRLEDSIDDSTLIRLYTQLLLAFIKVILFALVVFVMANICPLSLLVFRAVNSIKRCIQVLRDTMMPRQETINSNTLNLDATSDELQMPNNDNEDTDTEDLVEDDAADDTFSTTDYIPITNKEQVFHSILREKVPQLVSDLYPPSTAFVSPIPFFTCDMIPSPPRNYNDLSDEELGILEENERQKINAQLKCLDNLTLMVDTLTKLMGQYENAHSRASTDIPSGSRLEATTGNTADTN